MTSNTFFTPFQFKLLVHQLTVAGINICIWNVNIKAKNSEWHLHQGSTISMTQQIEYFSDLKDEMSTRLGAARVSDLLSKSIFLISAGANDAFDFFSQNKSPDSTTIQQFSEAMISTYDSHVKVRILINSLERRQIHMLWYLASGSKFAPLKQNHIWTELLLHLIILEGTS